VALGAQPSQVIALVALVAIAVAAVTACWLPARATAISPLEALRSE
jgi:ABC-type lipoprotein release transport system permease subunit